MRTKHKSQKPKQLEFKQTEEVKPLAIPEKKSDMAKLKTYIEHHAQWLGHKLGVWKKRWPTNDGGIVGRIRSCKCERCGTSVYIWPNGSSVGFPERAECPNNPNKVKKVKEF